MRQPKRGIGYALVELMVAIAMVLILMAVAMPSLQSSTHSTRVTAQIDRLTSFFTLARSEAVKRKNAIQVISQSRDDDNEWGGSVQMIDTATGDVIARLDPLNKDITVDNDADIKTITFISHGYASPSIAGNFNVCEAHSNNDGHQFMVTATGKVTLITRELTCL